MMAIIATLTSFAGFYCLYNTSRRADLRRDRLSRRLQKNRAASNVAGMCLLVVSFVSYIIAFGLGVGVVFAFITLITAASLIVLLTPLTITD